MFILKTIILWVFLTKAVTGENGNITCPRFCKCDSYQQLNRAQCSSKNLISAELILPSQVQILDLSYNDITVVDNKCFENFTHLLYLNLSHNALHTLDWDAFYKLRRLTEINLSHNRLEYLDERLFIKNKYLDKIDLSGNKLQTFDKRPLFRNSFVTELNLKNSQLNLLHPKLFAGLKNLKLLDLSQNLLNNFNVEDFEHLENLKELNLNDNFIKCNEEIKNKIQQLEKRGIKVHFKECKNERTQNQENMFEKLLMPKKLKEEAENGWSDGIKQWRLNLDFEEEEEELMENHNQKMEFDSQEIAFKSRNNKEWLRFAPDEILCGEENFILCQEYRTCLQDLRKAWHDQRQYREECSLNDIKFAFVMGIAIGVAAIVFILACALCLKRCLEVKQTAPIVIDSAEDLSALPLARPTTQLPPQVRRQPRRRAARPARSLVRYEGPVTENFLSRLFGRPARHQYYRSINQNTATLIRRLSRSNLFNNRLSQHFMESQTSNEANSPDGQGYSASAPRPETPPPSYGDVVIKNINNGK